MYTILGAGLSGLTIAYQLQDAGVAFEIFEAKDHGGGHIYSEVVDGFTWDEGPHISFTKHEFVKNFFAKNCNQEYFEFTTSPSNYFKGNWIPHPAQANMFAIPKELREKCLHDLKSVRVANPGGIAAANYTEWLYYAFGKTFSETFPEVYTKKYWTTSPENLATDWIGMRVYFPQLDDMLNSADGPLDKQTHYLTQFRYPKKGGFYSYIKDVEQKLPVSYGKKLKFISFDKKELKFEDESITSYDKLISTIPLPVLVLNSDAPEEIKAEARKLKCSKVLLINVVASHTTPVPHHWIYIYDEELYSTRINFTELLSENNGQPGKTGIQVEVYFSDYRTLDKTAEEIGQEVINELVIMGLAESRDAIESHHIKLIDWANVIFDLRREEAQDKVFHFLESKGMVRERDDLAPMTDWDTKFRDRIEIGDIVLAGRFAQWKYYWTDDCVLRGKYISENLK